MPRPIAAAIHLSALKNNYAIARQYGGNANVWAVVKANAYGHSLELAKQAFEQADGLALVEIDNAIKLRQLGWTKPILLLEGFFHAIDVPVICEYQFDVAVHSEQQIQLLEQAHFSDTDVIRVHLKVNTGMNRLGFKSSEVAKAYQRLCSIKSVQVVELMMHFANAHDPLNTRLSVEEQLHRFEMAKINVGHAALQVSLSNSAANLFYPIIKNDWVRAGIMLYGGSPSDATAASLGLQPAMTLSSELIAIQNIEAGEAVGYGSRFVADKPMRIGVVACGYADGYPRHAVDGTPVLVNGIRTRLIGCVSMDLITVDITDIVDAKVGSPVILWGRGLPIDDVARYSGTIGYELMCAVGRRVQLIADTSEKNAENHHG